MRGGEKLGRDREAIAGRTTGLKPGAPSPAPSLLLPQDAEIWSALWWHTLQPGQQRHPGRLGGSLGPGERGCAFPITILSGGLAGLPLYPGVSFLGGKSA